jgi:uncharacterized protein YdaU (DUF1376 family)
MKRPWMPLNIGEFLQDTMHLSTTEVGAYILLIMHYWARGGPCPNIDAFRRVTNLDNRQWLRSGDVLRSFFNDDLTHNRLDRDLAQVIEKSRINSTNVSKRYKNGSKVVDNSKPIRTTDITPKIDKDVVVVDAGAREPAKPLSENKQAVSPEKQAAVDLGLVFLKASGFEDYAAAPMNWYGVADRAAIWIANGWTEGMIVAETRMILERAAGGVPASIKYFETVFATAAARAAQPTPIVNVLPAESRNVASTNRRGNLACAFDQLIATARAHEADDGRSAGVRQEPARLLANR